MSEPLFDDAEIIEGQGLEIPRTSYSNNTKSSNSFTADSPYYTSFCETELRQVSVLSETLREISSRAKTFGKCGALMAESTRRLSSACRLEKQTTTTGSDDEGEESISKMEKDERVKLERQEAIGQDMTSVLKLLAEVSFCVRAFWCVSRVFVTLVVLTAHYFSLPIATSPPYSSP